MMARGLVPAVHNSQEALLTPSSLPTRANSKIFILIAPYCPPGRDGYKALGAATKIEAVIAGLMANGVNVILMNTGHQGTKASFGRTEWLQVGPSRIREVHPVTLWSRPLGKLLQAVLAPYYAWRMCSGHRVSGVWLYNAYLFEAIFGVCARVMIPRVPVVLELEDMPDARQRTGTGHLKVVLDNLALHSIIQRATVVTLVQSGLRSRLPATGAQIVDLPVLVQFMQPAVGESLQRTANLSVGYFGGLTAEKGVDHLVKLIRQAAPNISWHITGEGELADSLQALALARPEVVHFYGSVDREKFLKLYSKVDVIINLHRPLGLFGGGIFPFKVLEAVGAGKLLISTESDGCPKEVADAIIWIRSDVIEEASWSIGRLETLLAETAVKRAAAARWVHDRYGARAATAHVLSKL